MSSYFYRLGHARNIAIGEFLNVAQNQEIEVDQHWLFSSEYVPVERTGGIVFGGKVLTSIVTSPAQTKQAQPDLSQITKALTKHLESGREEGKYKKIGIATPSFMSSSLLKTAKTAGSRKVNVIADKLPNMGQFKGWSSWFILFNFEGNWVLGEILDHADQEFWTRLDVSLPHGDMRRGIMNLKLGRTLLNLTKNSKVWDPFCGQGRLFVGGADLKSDFIASDMEAVCLPDVIANYSIATQKWIYGRNPKSCATLHEPFEADARSLVDYFKESKDMFDLVHDSAVVTEGYLGKNFSSTPTQDQMRTEWDNVISIWSKTLKQLDKIGIKEVVFCLPYYGQDYLFDKKSQDKLVDKTNYRYEIAFKDAFVYIRKQTFVGHFILKVVKDNQ